MNSNVKTILYIQQDVQLGTAQMKIVPHGATFSPWTETTGAEDEKGVRR